MTAYYNENDPFAAAWLRQLIAAGHIAPGDVDDRSIEDVNPDELAPFTQCHFFAGIGGWSLALRMAGWPDDKPVWSGSPPCQPFSQAGKGAGTTDERHLWPAFLWHIQQCRPGIVLGEQVAGRRGLGWWDIVSSDLENADYACGAIGLGAGSVGAIHRRQRLYWFAHASSQRLPTWDERRIAGSADAPPAWREFERIHAANTWHLWRDQSGLGVFADGLPDRVGRMRGYGNAIVPQVAARFIQAIAR